jgi:RNA polymerase sigma-70 factor, ECF subfamily
MTQLADDRMLVARIAAADEAAMRALIGLHKIRVFRFLARLARSHALAEEVTNDVFTEVWFNAKKYEGRSSVLTWMLSIAHHRMVSRLRKRREEPLNEDEAGEIADAGDDPEVIAQKTNKSAAIRQCIERLSPAHREIIDLVYYHEQSIAEVSAILNVPEATVKTRMFYARKHLGEVLKSSGIDRGWP